MALEVDEVAQRVLEIMHALDQGHVHRQSAQSGAQVVAGAKKSSLVRA